MPAGTASQASEPEAGGRAGRPAIAVSGLERGYGDVRVLTGVSFELQAGETLVVLGPNGAGKTTLLRVLATLLRPNAGEVRVLGATLPREAWKARGNIGYLGHEPMLPRDLTVAEALGYHARLHSVASPGDRIAELLDRVGLGRRGDQLVRTLSAGQLQRAAACRCVLHSPALLLLDEPLSHLDPQGAETVEGLIGAAPGVARVLITHDAEGGLAAADRALALRADGSVAYEGPAGGLSPEAARAIYAGRR